LFLLLVVLRLFRVLRLVSEPGSSLLLALSPVNS
jgi:hypothetical protein